MFLWRISKHADLEGRGGLLAAARWHSQGRAIVYLAESPAGALVEVLVHLELEVASLPSHYRLLKAEAPRDLRVESALLEGLPSDWTRHLMASRNVGDEWLASGTSALLRVPSAILPETFNVLLNPEHPSAKQVRIVWHREYPFDPRLVRRGR
ncbi:MAG TPA: RES family NAD+ phosphorylase [Terriglobales bacterium]|nr:RES family NAD+ phosphorylase [Terriglobales bacterium]